MIKNFEQFFENKHIKIKLPQKFIDILSKLPEQGMGYQVVDITLKNGEVLKNKTVTNSEYLIYDEDIDPLDIIKIDVIKK